MSNPGEITEHTFATSRHTTGYLRSGPEDGPLVILCHGWPELSLSWRHQLPVLGALGFCAIAPDMRGYGRSSVYPRTEDYRQEAIVTDMIELLHGLGRDRAVWVGHDWGAPVVWNVASHYPDAVEGVAALCVPYIPEGFGVESVVPHVDRSIYPLDEYPVGQWDYQLYYREHFDRAVAVFESDLRGLVKALFRRGRADQLDKPAPTSRIRRDSGWFGGGPVPDLPQDFQVLTDSDLDAYTAALSDNGMFGADAWYVNHEANAEFASRSVNDSRIDVPVLFLHARFDTICQTVRTTLADPMRAACADLSEVVVDSGHWMAQEQPRAVNSALVRWLATTLPHYWPVGAAATGT